MARVQYGAIVTALKGNIGGQTFQNGNVSKVLRNKGYRAGGSSLAKSAQKQHLMGATSHWRTLSIANRLAWVTASGTWPFKDKFGNTYYSKGYQMYVAYSAALLKLGFPLDAVPNAPLSADDPGAISIGTWDNTNMFIDWVNVPAQDQFMEIFVTAPMSVGRSGNNVRYKYLATYNMIGSNQIDIWGDYAPVYGAVAAGNLIMVKLQIRVQQFPIIQFPTILQGFTT
jgi:hypothetical protein